MGLPATGPLKCLRLKLDRCYTPDRKPARSLCKFISKRQVILWERFEACAFRAKRPIPDMVRYAEAPGTKLNPQGR